MGYGLPGLLSSRPGISGLGVGLVFIGLGLGWIWENLVFLLNKNHKDHFVFHEIAGTISVNYFKDHS